VLCDAYEIIKNYLAKASGNLVQVGGCW